MPRWASVTMAAVWPLAVLICLGIGFNNWWVWIAAAMVTYSIRPAFGPRGPPDDPNSPRALGH